MEAGALFDHDAAGVLVPEGFAVGNFEKVAAEIEGPGRVEAGGGAGVEARGLHDLGRHEPARTLRVFFLARVCAARRGGLVLLLVGADVEGGAGEEGDAAVVAGAVVAVFLVAGGDVAQEAGEDAAVNGAVAGGAGGKLGGGAVGGGDAVEDGRHLEVLAGFEDVEELRVDIAPLADAGVAEEVIAAEAAEAGLGEAFELVVEGFPDGEEGEEIGVGVDEAAVGGVGLFAGVHGAVAGVLDGEAGGDDEDLVQGLFLAGLEDHASHGGINGQAGELAAEGGELGDGRGGLGTKT